MKYCKKCQVETERYTRGQCSQCIKDASAAYRVANPEKCKSYGSVWRKANPEKNKANITAWQKVNLEKVRANNKAWVLANKERYKKVVTLWRKANPEALRISAHNYRAKKLANGGKLSKGLSVTLFKLQKGKCPCCNKPLGADYEMDHITPIYRGGANEDWNIQLLRKRCNNQKRAKDPIDFMQSRGFLI